MQIDGKTNPPAVLEDIWKWLERAGADTRHAMHFPVLLSRGADYPEGRVVVLRRFRDGEFRIYTDARSSKVADFRRNSAAGLVFWDARHRIQIRVSGHITVRTGETAADMYERLPSEQTHDYRSDTAPGTVIAGPLDYEKKPEEQHHFCLLTLQAEKLDVLQIDRQGHLRIQYERNTAGNWSGQWVTP